VVVHGRNASHGAAVVDAITAEGGHARFAAADLGDPAGSGDLVRQAGPVDVLVNNTGQVGLPNAAAYSATKGALASMTRSWAAEFSPAGVRVNTVAPGPVHTAI
jgi:NAD(P)-dependent dehydrogenase (short-subunit alcohol dehydrogenase family)